MKRTFKILLIGAVALLAFAACDDDETESVIDNGQEEGYDDAYYAAQASVTSSDANFTATEDGGEIWFKAEGGSVTLSVSCGTQWTVGNTAADLFETSATSSSLTITAGQNTVERELEGTITLRTANQRIEFATINITQSAYGAPEISVEATEWGFPAKGVLTAEIAVEASADWTAATGDGWLTVARDGDVLRLAAEENAQTNERSAKVTLTCTDGIGTAYEYVTVTQEAGAYITTSPAAVTFLPAGGTTSVAVESNYEWTYSYDSSNGWFTVSRGDSGLTVSVTENDGDSRNGIITLTAGDGSENVVEVQLGVSQAGADAMVLTYMITSSNTTQLPLYGTVDCTVDWGDGTVERITSAQPSHTYPGSGEYDIAITGTVTALYSRGISTSDTPLPVTAVRQWGKTGLTDMQYAFYYCRRLVSLPEETGDVFADVTGFNYGLYYCTSLEEIPADLFDKCSKVTSFEGTFWSCSSLKTIPEGLFDSCTEVTNFQYTFYMCYDLKVIPAGLFDHCTKAAFFNYTFGFCTSLETIPESVFANCTEVNSFYNTFMNCTSLKEIPAGLFKSCTKVTSFCGTFLICTALEEIPAGLFDSCTEATDFGDIFSSCYALKTAPAGLFDSCTKVTSFRSLFYNCTVLTEIPAGLFDNCPEVTNFSNSFYGCSLIKTIPKGLFDSCPKVTTFYASFYQCYCLETIPEGLFDSCTEVEDFSFTFSFCSGITKIPEGLFDNCTKVTTFATVFQECSTIEEIPEGLFDNCPKVGSFRTAFNNCHALKTVPIGLFDNCMEVTDFFLTFQECSSVVGESPYTEIEVGGETVRVHLYDRADYTSELGCVAPTSYTGCFSGSAFSDIDSIPSAWGGNGN